MTAMTLQLERRRSGTPRTTRRPRRRRRWWLRIVVVVVVLVAVLAALFGVLLAATPSVRSAPALVARELAANHAPSDQGVVPYKVATALLATEDSRFYSDPALDPQGTARALWGLVSHNPNEGGATIEVQLAKMLYTPGRSDPVALAEQVALAFKLDWAFTKKQILAMYLDAAYFGDGAYGVTQAAQHYFGRSPSALTWGQASLLAGLVQAPSAYNPAHHLSMALLRRNHVLDRLVAVGALTSSQAQAIQNRPLYPAIRFSG